MAGKVEGKVAFITGAARGQGRSHALRLAEQGADIVAVDICAPIDSVPYPLATPGDLEQTVAEVRARGRRIVAATADVRDRATLDAAVQTGVAELGPLDVVCANAGVLSFAGIGQLTDAMWRDIIEINLTGVWNTVKAALPHLRSTGGSIILTNSAAGLRARPNLAHYITAKHGVVGLMRSLAVELAPQRIRVNCVHPTGVDTTMVMNEAMWALFRPDLDAPGRDDVQQRCQEMNALPVPWVDPIDVSNAVLFLASEEARYVTGVSLPVDAGSTIR